jgi:putative endonuclease
LILSRFKLGKSGEAQASSFLKAHGLVLLEERFRSRFGEIDLVMQDEEDLVFVEVKLRSHSRFGIGSESIQIQKQNKLIRTAQIYLQKKKRYNQPCRFDVVDIIGNQVNWIKNAFQLEN